MVLFKIVEQAISQFIIYVLKQYLFAQNTNKLTRLSQIQIGKLTAI